MRATSSASDPTPRPPSPAFVLAGMRATAPPSSGRLSSFRGGGRSPSVRMEKNPARRIPSDDSRGWKAPDEKAPERERREMLTLVLDSSAVASVEGDARIIRSENPLPPAKKVRRRALRRIEGLSNGGDAKC